MQRLRKGLLLMAVLFLAGGSLGAATHTINSAAGLSTLIAGGNVSPGDIIEWTDGTYMNQTIEFEGLSGTAANPITLRAQSPGGVVFQGTSPLTIAGDYLVVEGFYWNGGTGIRDHVQFRKDGSSTQVANYSVLRNCGFNDLTTNTDKSRWVVVFGQNNIVENCSFVNKNSTGASILVEVRLNDPGTPTNHLIQDNYFYNFPRKDGLQYANDSEGIRIGVSANQAWDAGVTVRNNYFNQVSGENEIISNKSTNNYYLDNTFRLCRGSLVLRHGAGAWVEGNYFIGDGTVSNSGGVRVSDSDHVIINNYMEGLLNQSDSWNAGIVIVSGDQPSGGTNSGYQVVNNVLIAFNTIYNSTKAVHFNDRTTTDPTNVTIANTLAYSDLGSEMIQGDGTVNTSGITWEGNIFYGSPVGYSDPGIAVSDPQFSFTNGLYRPSATGPAADSASGTYSMVTTDVELQSRPASGKDVGADEVSGATGAQALPFTDADVGSTVGCCFLGAAAQSIACGGGSGDTTPPAAPVNLAASAGDGSVSLDWDDNAEPDLDSYSVYRSTASGGPYSLLVSSVLTSDHIDNSVSNGTTYHYVITAVDTSDNESAFSNEASATPAGSGIPTLYVQDLQVDRVNLGGGQSRAQAVVTIHDNNAQPVSGASVTVSFTGAIVETVSGTTDISGVAIIESTVSGSNPARSTGCVDSVSHASYTYDSGDNVVTCDNTW